MEESIEKHKQAVKEVIGVYFLLHFLSFMPPLSLVPWYLA